MGFSSKNYETKLALSPSNTCMTLKECQAKFEQKHIYGVKPITRRWYARRLYLIVTFLGPDRDPRTIFSTDVKGFEAMQKEMGRRPVTIARDLQIASSLWKFMAELGVVENSLNPFQYRKYPSFRY